MSEARKLDAIEGWMLLFLSAMLSVFSIIDNSRIERLEDAVYRADSSHIEVAAPLGEESAGKE